MLDTDKKHAWQQWFTYIYKNVTLYDRFKDFILTAILKFWKCWQTCKYSKNERTINRGCFIYTHFDEEKCISPNNDYI